MIRGIHAKIIQAYDRIGWDIYMRKYEHGKIYKPLISIEWAECHEHERIEPLMVGHLTNHDSIDKESRLYGENESKKNEIEFLRNELSKAMERSYSK